ncbi:phosphotransferase [Microlunatus speluncae]|uniref:phosphotransferase n=1 Tax=Microlunatus speluncae TaxID=2594267 RepID=UPI001375EE3E|nr:phosphotransferase [Microlunatus speluncae]
MRAWAPANVTERPDHATRRTASVLDLARSRGLPVPRHHLVVAVGEDVFVVQQRLPGSPPTKITPAVVEAMIELNDRFAHLLADRPDVPSLPLCLTASGDPYPRHEVLAGHSDRSRRILAAIRAVGRELPGELPGDDLVHIDLTPPNVLVDDTGAVTGIVDWNLGAYRGDRHLALVKTRFDLEWALRSDHPAPASVAAAERLDRVLSARLKAPDLRRYWAHRMLYQLHWALQLESPEVVDWHLDVAEDRLFEPY